MTALRGLRLLIWLLCGLFILGLGVIGLLTIFSTAGLPLQSAVAMVFLFPVVVVYAFACAATQALLTLEDLSGKRSET